jgi:DNA-binding CsgD family transcriptional regulator
MWPVPDHESSSNSLKVQADPTYVEHWSRSWPGHRPRLLVRGEEISVDFEAFDEDREAKKVTGYSSFGLTTRIGDDFWCLVILRKSTLPSIDGARLRELRAILDQEVAVIEADIAELTKFSGRVLGLLSEQQVAVVLFDRHGRFCAQNACAEVLRDRVLDEPGGWPDITGNSFDARVAQQIEACLSAERSSQLQPLRTFLVQRADRRFLCSLANLSGSWSLPFARPRIGLFLRAIDERSAVPSEEALRQLFKLTGAEVRLARSLSGQSLPELAKDAGIAYETVRAHLRSVLAKTGAKRRADLVQLLEGLANYERTLDELLD